MSNEIDSWRKRVEALEEKTDGLIRDHSIIEKYVKAQDARVKDARNCLASDKLSLQSFNLDACGSTGTGCSWITAFDTSGAGYRWDA